MLRSAVARGLSTTTKSRVALARPSPWMSSLGCGTLRPTTNTQLSSLQQPWRKTALRSLATHKETPKEEDAKKDEDDTTKEIVLTPGQKVVAASRLTMWLGIAGFASVCAYYIIRELLPSKMSPNRVFDKAFDVARTHPEVQRRFGSPLKAYGRDHGGHREGRRNFIEHTKYDNPEDGSKRTRVRFNLEGPHGNAFVFAEVSNQMSSGEFVYVLVQDKANGRVITVVDNRAAMTAARLAGGDTQGLQAMTQLLSGGGNKPQ